MKNQITGILLLTVFSFTRPAIAQYPANTKAVQLSNAIMTRWSTAASGGRVCIDKMTAKGWEYSNSIVLHGMQKVYEKVNPTTYNSYLTYIKTYVDDYIDATGNVVAGEMAQNLDKIHPGVLVLFLYNKYKSTNATDSLRYRTAATFLRNYLIGPASTYPKTAEGGYFHKNNATYTDVMMLDGIYMAHPFLAQYAAVFNDNAARDTAINQALLLASHLHNSGNHLLYHAYDHARTRTWANAATGVSYEVWSRGMGWYVMAIVDILKYTPVSHPKRSALISLLQDLAIGMQANQDATSGLWYQVVNKPSGSPANYLEVTGSAMFVYALKTAIDSGWISNSYLTVANNGWTGLVNSLTTAGDGMIQVNSFAPAMGVQGTSAANAYSSYVGIAPVSTPSTAHPHGYAAILMAASVMELTPFVPLAVKFTQASAGSINGSDNRVRWSCEENNEVTVYSIEKSDNGQRFTEAARVNAQGLAAYSWTDPASGSHANYYRIKAMANDGRFWYSPVLAVLTKNGAAASLKVMPNPSRQEPLSLVMNQLKPGIYNVYVSSVSGAVIMKRTLQITENNSSGSIMLDTPSVPGIYTVTAEMKGQRISTRFTVY